MICNKPSLGKLGGRAGPNCSASLSQGKSEEDTRASFIDSFSISLHKSSLGTLICSLLCNRESSLYITKIHKTTLQRRM